MNTVYIPNLDVKVCTQKIDFPPGNSLRSLTPPKITRQRTLKHIDIEYDIIKY